MVDKELFPHPAGPKKIVFEGIIHGIEQQEMEVAPDKMKTFEKAIRPPGTRLIIVNLNEKRILLTKEHRPEQDGWDYRLPGGKVFDEFEKWQEFLKNGGDIETKAKEGAEKEGMEEAGIIIHDIKLLKKSNAGATIEWSLYYYLVTSYQKKSSGQDLGHGENIETVELTFEEAIQICLNGEMKEDRSVGVLLPYLLNNR